MLNAIVVAGGSGARFSQEHKKQFIKLGGQPVLLYSVNLFLSLGAQVVLVVPAEDIAEAERILGEAKLFDVTVSEGGRTRFHSVQKGVYSLSAKLKLWPLTAVHDAVRPALTKHIVEEGMAIAGAKGAAVPLIPITSSLRKAEEGGTMALLRREYFEVQTPQIFQHQLLAKAYQQHYKEAFTDCASVVEAAGLKVYPSEGSVSNLKLTHQHDYKALEFILANMNP